MIEEMLLNLATKISAIKIPSLMNASDAALSEARMQKNEVIQEIHRIRKLITEYEHLMI